jgi:hypothetical protein
MYFITKVDPNVRPFPRRSLLASIFCSKTPGKRQTTVVSIYSVLIPHHEMPATCIVPRVCAAAVSNVNVCDSESGHIPVFDVPTSHHDLRGAQYHLSKYVGV